MATSCSANLTDAIASQIKLGVPPRTAAACEGIEADTFTEWMARGARNGRGEHPYHKFRVAILKAEAECEKLLVARIRQAASNGNWQAAAWLAERRYPERYVRKSVNGTTIREPDLQDEPKPDRLDELVAKRHRRRSSLEDRGAQSKKRTWPDA